MQLRKDMLLEDVGDEVKALWEGTVSTWCEEWVGKIGDGGEKTVDERPIFLTVYGLETKLLLWRT